MQLNILGILILIVGLPFSSFGDSKMAEVTSEIEKINTMRENLVQGVQESVTQKTFEAVCKPVGMALKKVAKSKDLIARQVSFKFRNEKHKPNTLEAGVIKSMEADGNLISLWKRTSNGLQYFRRINTKKACLNCHGDKESRPSFVKRQYPRDKAFNFKVGELRGIYSILIKER